MNSVKRRMLSRRDLFRTASAGAAFAAVGVAASGNSAMAASHGRQIEDLTHELHADFPTYFGTSGFSSEAKFKFADNGFNLNVLTLNEHTGTHIDAPLHFSADGASVAEIPVSDLIAPLCVIDIAARAADNADAQLTPDDIKAWISANGDVPDGACVAMYSGWGAHVATDKFRNADADGKQHYPGFHVEAAKMLIEETGARSIGVDTLSLDYGFSADFVTHYAWLPSGRFGIENIANLDKMPANGATLFVGGPKHRGGSGGPARIIAMM